MKVTVTDLRQALSANPRISGAELCRKLKDINRSTLKRLIEQIDADVIRRGEARRTKYALRRALPLVAPTACPYTASTISVQVMQ